ncbi:hypothetical protein Tel_06135 [Candidatus Tenderia electrophaga]|uniref:Pyruvate kinase n=1 Tax=Candidatus Tenderia electrophaga TaxID=1748243 RepID=A0A0S2TI50_9GAMM|nr:hypothetical protein Tel_06135 [Candidatus Tenderia electrophaga]
MPCSPVQRLQTSLSDPLIALRSQIEQESHQILTQYCANEACLQHSKSARNLGHYLALRRHDLRQLQDQLAEAGLSSLGRCEAHVMYTLNRVINMLQRDVAAPIDPADLYGGPDYREGRRLLSDNTARLFGPPDAHRSTRIMVTLPSEAADDPRLVRDLMLRGMNCARINCAHDDHASWQCMVDNIVKARAETGADCAVLMDLAGQKIRTRLDPAAAKLHLHLDDRLLLARDLTTAPGGVAAVGCSHAQLIDSLHADQWAWFDDGKLGTIVDSIDEHGAWLHVVHCRPKGVKLRADKGINLPDTHIQLPCLTAKDLDDLDFVCRHADLVGFSFVQSRADMQTLIAELDQRHAAHLGIVAKIETRMAVKNLPEIILSALPRFRLGVMIARGDLAVELGGVRMAEIQEELLWLCEAAHVPVIWATQVLETLAKKGISSRPELTDAAMSGRAECVMLNKGPYILSAAGTLNSILVRMQDHQQKKRSHMRALHW